MIKLLLATRRRPGMTQAEFRHYVKDVHAPLVLQDPDAAELIRKYTQNHVLDAAYGAPGSVGYPVVSERDIITEIMFDGIEQMGQAQRTPMYVNVIRHDEDNFADQASVLVFPVREQEFEVARPRTAPVKVIHYLKQAAGSSDEDFVKRWSEAHESIMVANPEISDGFARYVQNYRVSPPHSEPEERTRYGVAMLWLDSREQLAVFEDYHRQLVGVSSQQRSFFDPEQSFCVISEEFVLKEQAL